MSMVRPLLLALAIVALGTLAQGCLPASRSSRTSTAGLSAHEALERGRASLSEHDARRGVLDEAERWIGTPYLYGGTGRNGVDCSGFVCNVFRTVSVQLPRTSVEISKGGTAVDVNHALPGDLVFFNTSGSGVSHVGIVVADDAFIHASTSNGVTVSRLSEPYYADHFMFARRILR